MTDRYFSLICCSLLSDLVVTSDINDGRFDGVLVVADDTKSLIAPLKEAISAYSQVLYASFYIVAL